MPLKKRLGRSQRILLFFVLLLFVVPDISAAAEPTANVLKLGVRSDCPPFSYRDPYSGGYRGYSVDLCLKIARNAQAFLHYQSYEFEEITAQNRFMKLHDGEIDILCEATTITQERLRVFGPTMYTFVSGASLMYSPVPTKHPEPAIGVLKGTTTENAVRTILNRQSDIDRERLKTFNLVDMDTHLKSLEAFKNGAIDLYMADREILLSLNRLAIQNKQRLIVSRNYYTVEPYALFLRLDDHDLRYIANVTLSEIFRKDIHQIFLDNFKNKRMNDSLRQLFRLQQLLQGVNPLPKRDADTPISSQP
jgi:ABC-type amino acid transport substrate-binding protein